MSKITEEITVVIKRDKQGNITVRYVGKMNDSTHPFGEEKSLTTGDINSAKALANKISSKLEK